MAGIIVYIYLHKLDEIYLGYFNKLIVPQCQDSQINHIFNFRRNILKIVIAENENLSIVPIVFNHFCSKIIYRNLLSHYSNKIKPTLDTTHAVYAAPRNFQAYFRH